MVPRHGSGALSSAATNINTSSSRKPHFESDHHSSISRFSQTSVSMHLIKTLSLAVVWILSTNATPFETQEGTGWRGPGFYHIFNRAGGSAIDLYNGQCKVGTPIYGWYVLGVQASNSPAHEQGPDQINRTPSQKNEHQIWLIARMQGCEYALLNHGTSSAVGATGGMYPAAGHERMHICLSFFASSGRAVTDLVCSH